VLGLEREQKADRSIEVYEGDRLPPALISVQIALTRKLYEASCEKHDEGKREMKEPATSFPATTLDMLIMQQSMLTFEAVLEGFALNVAFNSEIMTGDCIE
jgi:hypothetical protein